MRERGRAKRGDGWSVRPTFRSLTTWPLAWCSWPVMSSHFPLERNWVWLRRAFCLKTFAQWGFVSWTGSLSLTHPGSILLLSYRKNMGQFDSEQHSAYENWPWSWYPLSLNESFNYLVSGTDTLTRWELECRCTQQESLSQCCHFIETVNSLQQTKIW